MLLKLGEGIGVQNSSTPNRDQLVRYLNTAGREIWNTKDLPGTMFEQYFVVPVETNTVNPVTQITLPWYCKGIRAVRWAPPGEKLQLQDMYPRYQAKPWRQQLLTWRIKGTVPLSAPLDTAGQLTFVLPTAQTVNVDITVSGPVSQGASATETVTIPIGQLTATTTRQFLSPTPHRISKSVITTTDVIIRNAAGTDLGIIPNRQESAENLLVQVAEDSDYIGMRITGNVEVLYKMPYQELYFDQDVYISPDYEDCVVWRARANFEALQKDELALQRASALAQKCDELIGQLSANQESAVEMQMNFSPVPYHQAPRYSYGRRSGWTYGNFSQG